MTRTRWRSSALMLWYACGALLLACGRTTLWADAGIDAGVAEDAGHDAGLPADAGQDAGLDAGEADAGLCDVDAPWLSTADRDASPRSQEGAEILAREAAGTLTAPAPLYARVEVELPAIKNAYPWLQGVPVRPIWANELIVGFDAGAIATAALDGGYPAWNCLNARYGATSVRPLITRAVVLSFGPRLELSQLLPAYSRLPHVISVEANALVGDGSDTCLSLEAEGDVYLFVLGGGDCSSGCTERDFTGVLAAPDGGLAVLGHWNAFDGGVTEPTWLTSRSQACRGRLGWVFP